MQPFNPLSIYITNAVKDSVDETWTAADLQPE